MAQQTKPSTKKWAATGSVVSMDTTKQNLGWVDEKATYQKMNWLLQQMTQHLMHINEYGLGVWDAATDYAVGGLASLNGIKYECLQTPCVNQDPSTQPTYWAVYGAIAGEVRTFAMSTAPSGWLSCAGQSLSRTTYARLFAAISTTFGFVDGASFNLPDLRGEFVRGFDAGKGTDAGRAFGTSQGDQNKLHGHPYITATGNTNTDPDGPIAMDGNGTQVVQAAFTGTPTATAAQLIGGSGGNEARPRNVALLYCIKT